MINVDVIGEFVKYQWDHLHDVFELSPLLNGSSVTWKEVQHVNGTEYLSVVNQREGFEFGSAFVRGGAWELGLEYFNFLYCQYILSLPPHLIYGFVTFLIAQISFIVFNSPYVFLDLVEPQWAQKYQIQQEEKKKVTLKEIVRCLIVVNINHFLFLLPLNLTSFPVFCYIRGIPYDLDFPSPIAVFWQLLFCLMVEDVWSYSSHYLLHKNMWLYRNIHKEHHKYHAPFSWTATYAHPAEFLIGNIIPATLGNLILGTHVIVMWMFVSFRIFLTTEVHCGYKFPWSMHSLCPFFAGAEHHDCHHENNRGNFGSIFIHLDHVFDTLYVKKSPKKSKKDD
eukprot:Nk52_evm51s2039 gene=Nk52_evmTU51s2039